MLQFLLEFFRKTLDSCNSFPHHIPADNDMADEIAVIGVFSIRRACQESRLKYSDSHGKFLFRKEDVRRWVENG